ncbi:hypothetical protein MMC24_003462 [Lignoscripta atroalba]|nr:hypothetical protein [Lignoscripta atroalba]
MTAISFAQGRRWTNIQTEPGNINHAAASLTTLDGKIGESGEGHRISIRAAMIIPAARIVTNSHSAISAASARRNTSIARLQRLVDSAEQRTAQLADLLSPIEEHEEGGYKDPDVDFPVLDFSAFKASLDAVHGCPAIDEKSSTLQMSVLEIDGAIDAEMADVDMTEPPLVRILDPASTTASENLDEEFGFDSCSSETDAAEASPTSPRRNAWDWTIDGIGVALSIPDGLFKGERELDADGMDFEK